MKLTFSVAGLAVASMTYAMCAATTKNLVRVEVNACQGITIHASDSQSAAHRIHRRGSSVTGTLVTGTIIDSALVWDGDARSAEYLFETERMVAGESGSFFLSADASGTCAALLGTEATFVTDRPCCDVIPADGLCLVPATISIAKEEKKPERWKKWVPRN